MPFALIVIAIVLLVAGARGRTDKLKELLLGDFSGEGNFINWIIAIFGVGAIGYAPEARQFSRVFMALIILSMLLAKKGFFTQFMDAINNTKAAKWAEGKSEGLQGDIKAGKETLKGVIPPSLFGNPLGEGLKIITPDGKEVPFA